MEMRLVSPTKLILPVDNDEVRRFLTYTDRQVQFQIQRAKQNYRWAKTNPDAFLAYMDKLKAQQKVTLVKIDQDNQSYTYSGLWKELHERFGWKLVNEIQSPESPRDIPWATVPPEMRYYQKEAVEALLAARHGAISLSTGAGKSLVILNLCKRNPVQTVIMTPSAAITDQLYNDFVKYFGKKNVGKFGDGKKDYKKLFTVATGQSLTRVEQGTPEWEVLSQAKMFIADESHTTPAETFEAVCNGVASAAIHRFFVSATQLRTDGSELLLKGITGPIVYSKEFNDLVNEGYLKKPIFKTFKVPATTMSNQADVKKETRVQLYSNSSVIKMAADIATKSVTLANRPTVIIIEEFDQFLLLKNHLSVPFEFVHGGAGTKELKDKLPQEYWKCDTEQSVKNFNEGKTKLLIGTSAISTGVDLKPVGCLIYLQGGTSEIKVRQAIGRGTRIVPELKDFWVVDFKVMGSPAMERHFEARKSIYETMGNVEVFG